jgi:putative transposase
MKISSSAYYQWRKRKKSKRELENELILTEIKKIHLEPKKETYGAGRIQYELLEKGITACPARIRRIMKLNNIRALVRRKKFRYPKDTKSKLPVAENILDRNFIAESENKKWVSDITYIRTRQGWLYLCIVLDLYSKRIVGWSMDNNMKTGLILSALNMAVKLRGVSKGLIFHSDRGTQYRSNDFTKRIEKLKFIQSMSRKGNCWDNACAEAFFKTIKTELIYERFFKTHEEAKTCIFEYIEVFYNRIRRHSSIGNLSPEEFEEKCA